MPCAFCVLPPPNLPRRLLTRISLSLSLSNSGGLLAIGILKLVRFFGLRLPSNGR